MRIDPTSIFTIRDLSRARRLNRILSVLPRYHTGRRMNAKIINSLVDLVQAALPPSARQRVHLEKDEVAASDHHTIPIRLLRPRRRPQALLLHFHGGAWVVGNARLDDQWNARTVRLCNVMVAAGDFHRALDDDLERAIEDAVTLIDWALDHLASFGLDKLIVEGESSGAHLAAAALVRVAERRPIKRLAAFVSLCGAFDMGGSIRLRTSERSLLIDPQSALLNLDRLVHGPSLLDVGSPDVSPILADLSHMPPALFVAGALDPVKDDSTRMYERWHQQTGCAQLLVVPDAPHGFERLPTRVAAKTHAFVARWIERILGPA